MTTAAEPTLDMDLFEIIHNPDCFIIDGVKIRKTNEVPPRVSVYDVIAAVTNDSNPRTSFNRLVAQYPEGVAASYTFKKFPGRGQNNTPITNARGFVTIINLLPGPRAARFRAASADIIVRYMGGDPTLVDEILRTREAQQQLPEDNFARFFGADVEAKSAESVSTFVAPSDFGSSEVIPYTLPTDASWESHFAFDVRALLSGGAYLELVFGTIIDGPELTPEHIICKGGKAVDQPIGGRVDDYKKLHPDNRVIFAIFAKFPGAAEKRLKMLARTRGWMRTGKYSDGKNGQEFIVFLPEDAAELRRFYEIACEEDNTLDVEQETTKRLQIEADTRKVEAESAARVAEASPINAEARKAEAEARKAEAESAARVAEADARKMEAQLSILQLQSNIIVDPESAPMPEPIATVVALPPTVLPGLQNTTTTGVFSRNVYVRFIEECCERNATARGFIVDLLNAFSTFYKRHKILPNGPVEGGNSHGYGFNPAFKREFIDQMSGILNSRYVGLTTSPKRKGFYGVGLLL